MPASAPKPRSPGKKLAVGTAAFLALSVAGFFAIGPKRVWHYAAGPADQGAIDFARLTRRSAPNDSLACSSGLCSQPVDVELPTYAGTPAALMAKLDAVVAAMGDAERVDDGRDPAYRRFVFYSRILEFPDTLDARAVETAGGTGLQLYSRSLLGRGDFGANRARLERIARRLETAGTVAAAGRRKSLSGSTG
ncbi:DUF1499 domain-containing protein [Jiella sonneratiae]|uniref:DUF1499 domain-containing protein n=1 Tax=Jiella sonneratiae TaxID=2816856 RepID=A0ABS3J2Z1_9HYPH|nr:DUF1499 domain-containing protein [Jiella sonneratiae]MBO0904037.1 DUF1499 domain-containing protein [Jiella sonneratiae]